MREFMKENPVLSYFMFLTVMVVLERVITAFINRNKPILKCSHCEDEYEEEYEEEYEDEDEDEYEDEED
jgi:hypothetical protein